MNKRERKNVSNYISVADELYIEKVSKAEEKIDKIIDQIDNINEALDQMQNKIRENPEIIDLSNQRYMQQNIDNISNTIEMQYKDIPNKTITDKTKEQEIKEPNKVKKILSWLGQAIFYIVIIAMILTAFLIKSNQNGRPTNIAGYSMFRVLTGSMEKEIPQGSLVITKEVDPKTLQIGDDITFMMNENTIVTHRIVGIMESYKDTGERAFETQGVMNKKPDKEPVLAANVIGKVVYHNKVLGEIAAFLEQNWPFLVFAVVVFFVFSRVLKSIYGKDGEETNQKAEKNKPKKITKIQINRRIQKNGKRHRNKGKRMK